jgi:D-xylose transport system substrate-binding protein
MRRHPAKSAALLGPLALAVGLLSGCTGGNPGSLPPGPTGTEAPPATTQVGGSFPASSFTGNFAAMARLSSIAAAGVGKVAAILSAGAGDSSSSGNAAPDITEALSVAGLPNVDIIVQSAADNAGVQLQDAESDIINGATVLVLEPIDTEVGASIGSYAQAHGVDVIDFDRLPLGGSAQYYVGFNDVDAGKLLGQGLEGCVTGWHVAKPRVAIMPGPPNDQKAALLAQGYNSILDPLFASHAWTDVTSTAGTWSSPVAETEFRNAYAAHSSINAALTPTDQIGASIVAYLKTLHVPPWTFPTTGQDATLAGLQNVLSGYQCGTVYEPVSLEAQGAVALALYLRAHESPPPGLLNGVIQVATSHVEVPSVLLTPEWVTSANMAATVIADRTVTVTQLCAGSYASECKTAGIK